MRLAGKVVIVTGGSQGIGEAFAKAIAAEGGKVAVAGTNLEKSGKSYAPSRRRAASPRFT